MQAPGARRPRLFGAPALLALPFFAWLVWRFDFLVDDAFISYRYGHHLAHGQGLVWNPGEDPPVEGFSNFLWTVLCAGFERLGLDPALWTRSVGAACGALLVVLVGRLVLARTREVRGSDPDRASDLVTATLAAIWVATLPPIALWSSGGLETMAFALAVFATFERLVLDRERPHGLAAGVCGALAVLLRADGFVWVGIALAAAPVLALRERNGRLARAILLAAVLTAVAALGYLAFRWSYFGELGPNTARIKVAFGPRYLARGAQYVLSLLMCVLSVPLAIAGGASRARRDPLGLAAPALVAVFASFAYVIVLGGDWMMMYRMLVPALPFAALLFAAWIDSFGSRAGRVAVGAACVGLSVLPAFDLHLVPRRVRELAHFRWSQDFRSEYAMWRKAVVDIGDWIETGRALGLFTKPGESMVLGNIGALGYYAPELVVYDTQGLTNREPLLPLDPKAREMPGHDRKVQIDSFQKYRPTYYISKVVDAREPWRVVPLKWRDELPDGTFRFPNDYARALYEFELHPLDPALGFAPDRSLLLIRYRY